jgi:predicted transcriptional regulator
VFARPGRARATGLTPGTMAEALNIPANTLSFHLKELTHAGLVTQERSSRNIIYRRRSSE